MPLNIFWSDDRPEQTAFWREKLEKLSHNVDDFKRLPEATISVLKKEYDIYLIDILQPMGRKLIPELSVHLSHLKLGPRTERGGLALARYIKSIKPNASVVIVTNQKELADQLLKEIPSIVCRVKNSTDFSIDYIIKTATDGKQKSNV